MNGTALALLPLPLDPKECVLLLKSLTRSRSLRLASQFHALLLSSGLLPSPSPSPSPQPPSPSAPPHQFLILSKLAAMYSLCGQLPPARHLFDVIPKKDPFLWNTLIRGHVQCGLHLDALRLFSCMVSSSHRPDHFTYPFALKACGDLSMPELGAGIHARALTSGFGDDEYVQNCLIAMHMNCGNCDEAARVFDGMTCRSVVSWNTMISGYCRQNGFLEEGMALFDRMLDAGMEIDEATLSSVLQACALLKDLRRGLLVHKMVDKKGLGGDLLVNNSLIDMYGKCGRLKEARGVFDSGKFERDIVSWTAMLGGYAHHGHEMKALELYGHMQLGGVRPNAVTMITLLSACAALRSIEHGKCIHALCIRLRLNGDIIVETALIDMYTKCNSVGISSIVLSRGSRRTATWNAIISGCSRNEQEEEAIKYFKLMLEEEARPDLATITSLLPAYSNSADRPLAQNIHGYMVRMGFMGSNEAVTGLIDIYAKDGDLDLALELFNDLNVKDFVSWSAIIGGFGMHGHARTAIWLFDRMVESGVSPSEVTYTSLLYSCSHAGLVDEGLHLFDRMFKSRDLKPNADHYACVVDLLGRVGRLQEAYEMIRGMPFDPNHAVWGALLGACVIHENAELGELAAKKLFEIEPENTGNYVLLGNIYAALGRWDDVETVRNVMTERGLRKDPGHSLLGAANA